MSELILGSYAVCNSVSMATDQQMPGIHAVVCFSAVKAVAEHGVAIEFCA